MSQRTGVALSKPEPIPDHTHERAGGEGGDLADYLRLSRTATQTVEGTLVLGNGVVVEAGVTFPNLNTTPSQTVIGAYICTVGAESVTDARAWQYPDRTGAAGVVPLEARHRAVAAKTANYTLTEADDIVLGDATGGAFTLTLPTAAGKTGRIYMAKKTDAGANAVTLDGSGAETIDGAATLALTAAAPRAIVSDGTNWQTVAT